MEGGFRVFSYFKEIFSLFYREDQVWWQMFWKKYICILQLGGGCFLLLLWRGDIFSLKEERKKIQSYIYIDSIGDSYYADEGIKVQGNFSMSFIPRSAC